jgi:hypothetical protein
MTPSEYWLGVISWEDLLYTDTATKFSGKGPSHIFETPADTCARLRTTNCRTSIPHGGLTTSASAMNPSTITLATSTYTHVQRRSHRKRPWLPPLSSERILHRLPRYWDAKMVELLKDKQGKPHELVVKTQCTGSANLKDIDPYAETWPYGTNRTRRPGASLQSMEDAYDDGIDRNAPKNTVEIARSITQRPTPVGQVPRETKGAHATLYRTNTR